MVTLLFLIVILVFPFVIHNGYYDITITKYKFVLYTSIGFMAIMYLLICMQPVWPRKNAKSVAIVIYFAFFIGAVISALLSEYGWDKCFSGTVHRRNGILIWFIYGMIFYLVMQHGKFKSWMIDIFEIGAVVVAGIGILNHFKIDPFLCFWDLAKYQQPMFVSTIGHMDLFANYLSVAFGITAIMLLLTKSRLLFFHAIIYVILAMAIPASGNNGVYIGIAVAFVTCVCLTKTLSQLRRIFAMGSIFFLMHGVVGVLDRLTKSGKELDGIAKFLSKSSVSVLGIFVSMVGIVAISFIIQRKHDCSISFLTKWAVGVIIMVLAVVMILFILGNAINLFPEGSLLYRAFHLTDKWGNYRGYIWKKTWNYYWQLPLLHKLLGIGPDTAMYAYETICTESFLTDYGNYYENAHNEYLQMLLTHGLFGMITYFGWMGFTIHKLISSHKNALKAIGVGVLAYAGIAFVSINAINVMAIVVVIMAIGMSGVEG